MTQGGKALEAIGEIKNYIDDHKEDQLTDGERAVITDISTIISSVNLEGGELGAS